MNSTGVRRKLRLAKLKLRVVVNTAPQRKMVPVRHHLPQGVARSPVGAARVPTGKKRGGGRKSSVGASVSPTDKQRGPRVATPILVRPWPLNLVMSGLPDSIFTGALYPPRASPTLQMGRRGHPWRLCGVGSPGRYELERDAGDKGIEFQIACQRRNFWVVSDQRVQPFLATLRLADQDLCDRTRKPNFTVTCG
jgi:hypothetical protein